ncbi:MAG: Gp15 family bacteriophage protein [Clostridium sp.]
MRRQRLDFRKKQNNETYYDIFEDYELIESSFAKQYGIRLRNESNMSWSEFCSLLSGIMPNTPLGQIVAIRSEKDPKKIKNFTKEQRKIRNDWIIRRNKKLRENPEAYNAYIENLQNWAKTTFGGDN